MKQEQKQAVLDLECLVDLEGSQGYLAVARAAKHARQRDAELDVRK